MRARAVTIATVVVLAWSSDARADATDRCIASAEKAQRLRRDARLRAAREELIGCAREACPSAIARDCKRWLGEVEASLPSVVVRVVDAEGRDVPDALVSIDAEPGAKADGRALPIDPGEHAIVAEHGGVTTRTSIVVASGEHERLITLRLGGARATSPAPVAPSPSIAPLTWVLGGVGLVAAGAGVFFWLDGRSDRASLFATCGVSRTCTTDDKDRAQTKLVVGDVLVATGVVALGAAVVVGITSVRVGASPTAGGGVLVGSGAF